MPLMILRTQRKANMDETRDLPAAVALIGVIAIAYVLLGSAIWWIHKIAHPHTAGHLKLFLAWGNRSISLQELAASVLSTVVAIVSVVAIHGWRRQPNSSARRTIQGRTRLAIMIAGGLTVVAVVLVLKTETFA